MILRKTDEEELSPIIIYNDHLGGLEYIWSLLEKRFRQAGHRRPLIFKEYDCYKELPGTDGDLYTYDAIVLSALTDKRLFRSLPKSVSFGMFFHGLQKKQKSGKDPMVCPLCFAPMH